MPFSPKSVFAPQPHTKRGVPLVLHGDPKGKNILYTVGHSVIIRDIENPSIADVYTQHSVNATVACYAPSGYYIASGDVSGKIRIWDTTQKEHILKYEYQPIAGRIKDIAWSPDSKRIAVCGEGREKFGHVFLWDSGSSVGDIMGHSKFINSIDYRPSRPFRVATAGEDNLVCWFEGPPFRYKQTLKEHSRFVNAIRFSPDGSLLCSGGADCKAVLYDGNTGEVKGCLGGEKTHNGGVYAVSWSPDSKQLLTASADKSCKLWDATTCQIVSEFKMGSALEDQQLGCLWQGPHMLSVSLAGYINYLDINNPNKPLKILKGQSTNLNSITYASDTVYAGSMDGRISHWGVESGEIDLVSGPGHTNNICCLQATSENILSLGLDKKLKKTSLATNEFCDDGVTLAGLDPTDLCVTSDGAIIVTTLTEIVIISDGKRVGSMSVNYQPQTITAHPDKQEVVVGGKDNSMHVYTVSGNSLTEKKSFQAGKEVVGAEYSPDGNTLAINSGRSILLFDTDNYQQVRDLLFHTAKVMSISWSPNSTYIVSGSIDTNVIVWTATTGDRDEIRGAHPLSIVTGVVWVSDTVFATCGHDNCIRVWERTTA